MGAPLASAIYEGWVRHRRHAPRPHAFRYRIALLYLDLGELPRLFQGRWLWSYGHTNLAQFRRSDYLGPGGGPRGGAGGRRGGGPNRRRPAGAPPRRSQRRDRGAGVAAGGCAGVGPPGGRGGCVRPRGAPPLGRRPPPRGRGNRCGGTGPG
ncbi:DUF1365 family protein, partial [Frateuria sp.]|uniref:DUF1365 family protein n=1 Tax=Frateuria sp. TaxID=2211372 RepID=UPI003F7DBFFA